MATGVQVVFDCADPDAQALFWAGALGCIVQPPPDGFPDREAFLRSLGQEDRLGSASAVVDPDGAGPRIYFQRVPEPKTTKNRIHLDLNISQWHTLGREEGRRRVLAEVARLTVLGARQVRVGEEHGQFWVVMRDPEGNEFCVH
jgi:Glyoxalase-like domain